VAWSKEDPYLFAACAYDGALTTWDIRDPYFPYFSENHLGGGFPISLSWTSADYKKLVVAVDSGRITHFGAVGVKGKAQRSTVYSYHNYQVWSLDCCNLSRELLATCADGTVTTYPLTPKLHTLRNRASEVGIILDTTHYNPDEDTYTFQDVYDDDFRPRINDEIERTKSSDTPFKKKKERKTSRAYAGCTPCYAYSSGGVSCS